MLLRNESFTLRLGEMLRNVIDWILGDVSERHHLHSYVFEPPCWQSWDILQHISNFVELLNEKELLPKRSTFQKMVWHSFHTYTISCHEFVHTLCIVDKYYKTLIMKGISIKAQWVLRMFCYLQCIWILNWDTIYFWSLWNFAKVVLKGFEII